MTTVEGAFGADAVILRPQESGSASFAYDAFSDAFDVFPIPNISASALFFSQSASPITAQAWITFRYTVTISADAVKFRRFTPTFTANAVRFKPGISKTFTADFGTRYPPIELTFTADAITRVPVGSAGAYSGKILAAAPIHYWKLNETTGTAILDYGSSVTNGTYGSVTLGQPNAPNLDGTSVLFNGATRQATLAAATGSPTGNSDRTIEVWIKNSRTDTRVVYGYGAAGGGAQFVLILNYSSAQLCISLYGNDGGVNAGGLTNNGSWHHVAVTYTGANHLMEFWVDGTSYGTRNPGGNLSTQATGARIAELFYADGWGSFIGNMSHLAVYGRVLSPAEIVSHAAGGGLGLTFSVDASLVATRLRSLTADAKIYQPNWLADAVLRASQTASLTADAQFTSASYILALAADAVLTKASGGSFSAAALLVGTVSRTVTADARFRIVATGSFSADANINYQSSRPANAVIRRSISGSFGGGASIYRPRTSPPGPPPTPLVRIMVGGIDITADVIYEDATFTMRVNGAVGSFDMRVRDDGHGYAFVTGSEVTVEIDGKERFGGYLTQVGRVFAFDVADTRNPATTPRIWHLTGPDYNILLTKRILYDHDNLANMNLRSWPAGSRDDDVIRYVITNYSDLLDDGVTLSNIQHLGSPNPDKTGVIGSASHTVLDALTEINRLLSGVFYIGPGKDLNYVDVDLVTAPIGLSDHPGAGQVGFQGFEHTANGSAMVNDALIWGIGMGWPDAAFSRSTDDASIAAHGRWQYGELTNGLYKQASVDERAHSMVYGTAQSLRGGKDDKQSWQVTVFDQPFMVGQVVNIESEVFGLSDAVPIRALTLSFTSPTHYKLDLTLSHEIDEPWNLFEWYFPPLASINVGKVIVPKIVVPPPPAPVSGGCDCGITDTFDRVATGGWGTSDVGIAWLTYPEYGPVFVDYGTATYGADQHADPNNYFNWLELPIEPPPQNFVATTSVKLSGDFMWIGGELWEIDSKWGLFQNGDTQKWRLDLGYGIDEETGQVNSLALFHCTYWYQADRVSTSTPFTMALDTWYDIKIELQYGVLARAKVWQQGTPEPADWTLSMDTSGIPAPWPLPRFGDGTYWWYSQLYARDDQHQASISYALFDLPWVNRCSEYRFDNFSRTVASGWGTSDYGTTYAPITGSVSVDGSHGVIPTTTGVSITAPALPPIGSTMDLRMAFTAASASGLADLRLVLYPTPSGLDYPFSQVEFQTQSYFGAGNGTVVINRDSNFTELPFTFTPGARYQTRIVVSATQTDVYLWADGAAEPSTPTLANAQSFATGEAPASLIISNGGFVSATGTPYLIDYIDFDYTGKPCYQDCGGTVIFDSFNRSVASGWGTGDVGQVWAVRQGMVSASGAPVSVDGANGVVAASGSGSTSWTAQQCANPVPTGPFIMTARIRSQWGAQFEFFMTDAATGDFTGSSTYDDVFVRLDGGPLWVSGNRPAPSYWNDASVAVFTEMAWCTLKWELQPGVVARAKVWQDGAAEPDWQVSSDLTGFPSATEPYFVVMVGENDGGTESGYIDYITFTSTTTVFDTFSRTVSPGWGTSDYGAAWGWYSYYPALDYPSVGGGLGEIRHRHNNYPGTQGYVYVDTTAWSALPWHDHFTMSCRFSFPSLPTNYTGYEHTVLGINYGGNYGWPDDGIGFEDHTSGGGQYLYLNDSTGTHETSMSFSVGVTYLARFEYNAGGAVRAKCWVDGTAEPEWMLTGTAHGDSEPSFNIFTQGGGATEDYAIAFDYIDFDYPGKGCTDVMPGEGSSGTSISGGGRDDTTSSGSALIQVATAYVPLSSRIYIDGLFLRLGVDYTESSPAQGQMTLTNAPAAGAAITVFYEAAGSRVT